MKIEGMDAVKNAIPVSAISPEQTPAKLEASVKVRVRPAISREQAGNVGNRVKKFRSAADSRVLDLKYLQQEDGMSEKFVRDAIDRANRLLAGSDRKFEISVHDKTKQIMIKVLDAETNETIREIPPEKIVDLVVLICEMAGILYDEKG